MKRPIKDLMLLSCLIVMLPLTSEPSYSQSLTSITESDIHAMINAMDKAARKGNVAGMIAPIASDAKIKLTVVGPKTDKEVTVTFTKEQFAHTARVTMRRKISYNFERKNIRIEIYDDTTAMVTSELYETLKLPEGTLRSSSSEELYISLRDGKLVITSSETRGRFY